MKRKLSLLLAMVLAMTMVMGIGVTAFAAPTGTGSWDNPYTISSLSEGDQLTLTDSNKFFKNDTGSKIYICVDANNRAYFTHEQSEYDDFSGGYKNFIINNDKGPISVSGTIVISFTKSAPIPPQSNSSVSTHVHNFQWQTITEPTKDTDGLEGEMCSCGAVKNTQPLSAYGYALNEYATPMINAAKSGQTITFEFGEWNSFPKSFMAKLVDKSAQNVTFVFHYKWNHVKQEITIPAGTPIDLNFDWYGPAKMAELYGAN